MSVDQSVSITKLPEGIPYEFPILISMVLVWFVLLHLLFSRLEKRHPMKYEAMGRPSLILRNHLAGTLAMLAFLVRREHRALGDSYLSKLSDGMLVFFAAYLVLFLGLFFSVWVPAGST